jgi:hypothetical protein
MWAVRTAINELNTEKSTVDAQKDYQKSWGLNSNFKKEKDEDFHPSFLRIQTLKNKLLPSSNLPKYPKEIGYPILAMR